MKLFLPGSLGSFSYNLHSNIPPHTPSMSDKYSLSINFIFKSV